MQPSSRQFPSDLGLDEMELRMICEDTDMYPEEQIEIIANRLGFAEELAEMIDEN